MKNVLVVTNFCAGRKKAIKYKKRILEFILKNSNSFKFIELNQLNTIDASSFDTIIAVGGDGTVNKILPFVINTDKILGIIPCGTANLLASKLGISSNIKKSLKILNENCIKKVDVLKINDELSILRNGFGYDSDIICKTPQSLKNKFGYFAYFIAGILFALRLKKKEYKLSIDNTNLVTEASCIIVANAANMYRNFISLSTNSQVDDGLMDIFILKTTNPILFFIELILIGLNIRKNSNRAEYIKAEKFGMENNWLACHIDGEKKIFKENINIHIIEHAINVSAK